MKIFLMTDMEGVCGVINHDDWVIPSGRYYEEGKKLLTAEVNAAVEGFFSAGAEEIVVVDGHGAGGINQMLLDKRTYYSRGWHGPWPFGLDASFDAAAWVGQHAKAGTPFAHIAHTGWFNVVDYRINGTSVGEFGQLAMIASSMEIPSIFGSGDEAFTKEAQELVPGIETVAVKRGVIPGNGDECNTAEYMRRNLGCIHLHPAKSVELIRDGAEKALKRLICNKESFSLINIRPPFRREVRYRADERREAYSAFAEHSNDIVAMMNTSEKVFKFYK